VICIERIPTGIPGLDEAIQGGFPSPSVLLLLGEPGTGKTTFAMQSLFHGAKNGETVIYMTGVAEPVFMIKKFMSNFAFYDGSLIENSKIQFWDLGSSIQTMGTKKALDAITDIVRETNASRVIIDPLPLAQLFSSMTDYRKYLYDFLTALRNLQVFTIIVGEKSDDDKNDLESYMVDAVVVLYLKTLDNPLSYKNLIRIRKMRGTNHTRDMMAVDITKDGMRVYSMA
jgi:circadian clock protein KaiC